MQKIPNGVARIYESKTPAAMEKTSLAVFTAEVRAGNFTRENGKSLLFVHWQHSKQLELWAASLARIDTSTYIVAPIELAMAYGPPDSNVFNTDYDALGQFREADTVIIRHLFMSRINKIMTKKDISLIAYAVEDLVLSGVTVIAGIDTPDTPIDCYGSHFAGFIESYFELVDANEEQANDKTQRKHRRT